MTHAVRRRSVRTLIGAWLAYWIALIAITMWPAIRLGWQLSRADQHGSASAGIDNSTVHLTIMQGAATAWTGAASIGSVLLWLTMPALIIWAIWLVAARPPVDAARVAAPRPLDALPAADPTAMPTPARESQRERKR